MSSDDVGFAAFLLLALSAVVLSVTSAASLFLAWKRQIRVPGEPEGLRPLQSDFRPLGALHAICIIFVFLLLSC